MPKTPHVVAGSPLVTLRRSSFDPQQAPPAGPAYRAAAASVLHVSLPGPAGSGVGGGGGGHDAVGVARLRPPPSPSRVLQDPDPTGGSLAPPRSPSLAPLPPPSLSIESLDLGAAAAGAVAAPSSSGAAGSLDDWAYVLLMSECKRMPVEHVELLLDYFRLPPPHPDDPHEVMARIYAENSCAPAGLARLALALLGFSRTLGERVPARQVMAQLPADLSQQRRVLAQLNLCSEITARIFVSGVTAARDGALLRRLGITHVLNCGEREIGVEHPGIVTAHLEMVDNASQAMAGSVAAALQFLAAALTPGGTTKVLIHCYAGMSRSPTIAAAFLAAANNGWSGIEALEFVRKGRPPVRPNGAFLQYLLGLVPGTLQLPPQGAVSLPAPGAAADGRCDSDDSGDEADGAAGAARL